QLEVQHTDAGRIGEAAAYDLVGSEVVLVDKSLDLGATRRLGFDADIRAIRIDSQQLEQCLADVCSHIQYCSSGTLIEHLVEDLGQFGLVAPDMGGKKGK